MPKSYGHGRTYMDLSKIFIGHAEVLFERAKTKALLGDMLHNDMTMVYALMSAYDLDIVNIVEKGGQLDPIEKSGLADRMTTRFSMIEKSARWSVDTWALMLNPALMAELKEKKEEIERARERDAMALLARSETSPSDDEKDAADTAEDTAENMANDVSEDTEHEIAFLSKDDVSDYYTNVRLTKKEGRIFIPCGYGNTDNGFFICGIKESSSPTVTESKNVYALVYNYMTRSSGMSADDIPKYIKGIEAPFYIDYQRIFRLSMIILQMVKNDFFCKSNTLSIKYKNKDELELAIGLINDYARRFSHLIGIDAPILKNRVTESSVGVSIDKRINGIYIEENDAPCNAREIWFGQKIRYRLSEREHLAELEYILSEISDFEHFKDGQLEALSSMLSTDEHSVCIMPTGSGKSLIFYMASLLQPLPMFVLSPTDILIEDQLRNLKKFHRIDNVSHLKLTESNDFSDFTITTSLMYLTPSTFQNRNLLVKCRYINNGTALFGAKERSIAAGALVSYVVLDEIHCLSNLGHDFRAEYLMLSHFLAKFLDRTTFLGFSATANYTVIEDIQKQLKIPPDNIFSPIALKKDNIRYDIRESDSTEGMLDEVCSIAHTALDRGERTIIFAKNDDIALEIAQRIGYEADVFLHDNTAAYHLFADGGCDLLVACEDIGIGVNLPNIQNVVHFGLPVSKHEYVQQIGRAGRADEKVCSYVLYLKKTSENIPLPLLKRTTDIEGICDILDSMNNDYSDCYRRLSGGFDSKKELYDTLVELKGELSRPLVVKNYPADGIEKIKRRIYMLYVLGYIKDWYSCSALNRDGSISILMSITNNESEHTEPLLLKRMKQTALEYYSFLGENREQIAKTQRSRSIEEIIGIYVDWYYAKLLYHHKEMFLDLLSFIEEAKGKSDPEITEEIKDYFTLPFIEIKSDEAKYRTMPLCDITKKLLGGIDKNTMANIERLNGNSYSYSLDCFILLYDLLSHSHLDESRLERVISKTHPKMHLTLLESVARIYERVDIDGRFSALKSLERHADTFSLTLEELCEILYESAEEDIIYYGILSRSCNKLTKSLGGYDDAN